MNKISTAKKTIFNSDMLKIIAVVLMILNHFCYSYSKFISSSSYFMSDAHWYITRASFVIYCFFISEGMIKTHDRTKYLTRLLLFCFLSEIPFDLCFYNSLFYIQSQNVFFTLFLGALSIYFYDEFFDRPYIWKLILFACCAVSALIISDYSYLGVLLIFIFYVSRESKYRFLICAVSFLIIYFIKLLVSYSPVIYNLGIESALDGIYGSFSKEAHGLLAFPLLAMYNGERGKIKHRIFFYLVYPVHLVIIWLIISIINIR